MSIRRAFLSVYDKSGLTAFAQGLRDMGVEIVSSGGTARSLRDSGVEVRSVSELTGFPQILGGRVKTLHPAVHGGILARRDQAEHMKELEEHGIEAFDLVAVNLYPFEETVTASSVKLADAVEQIDIGGSALIRAAAKNFRHVYIVCDPSDYETVLEAARVGSEGGKDDLKHRLAAKAFRHTAYYDSLIARYLSDQESSDSPDPASSGRLSKTITMGYRQENSLRYGENPHQWAAFYKDPLCTSGGFADAKQHQGKKLSFNNLMDADAAWKLCLEFQDPVAVILKHANPCGAAEGDDILTAFRAALSTDPLSAFGGIIGFNREVTGEVAEAMAKNFTEVVLAPAYNEDALKVFSKKKNLRVLEMRPLPESPVGRLNFRPVLGGLLLQQEDLGAPGDRPEAWTVATRRRPSDEEMKTLEFAWKIVKHVKSNAIVYARGRQTVGVGAGQMSRVDSAKLAREKALDSLEGAVMSSDAFFPFRDGIDAAAEAGITAVIQPGGSKRDGEVVEAADEHGMAMVFTGVRHFRH